MSAPNLPAPFRVFCARVTEEIRHRPARRGVAAELAAHLEDHAEKLRQTGADEELAQRRSVEAMGDPVTLGKALDAVHSPFWHDVARLLATIAVCLSVLFFLFNNDGVQSFAYDLADALAPPPDPAAESIYYNSLGVTPLRTGRAQGRGRLGDYRVRTSGPAALVWERPEGGEPYLVLRFPLSVSHWQPWLGEPDYYALTCRAWDDRGGAYLAGDDDERHCDVSYGGVVSVEDPDPLADAYTVHLSAPNGDSVTLTVTLDEEVPAP